jgi:hypothetical protein
VLYNCGALYEGTASATGTTGTLLDSALSVGATDDHRGKYIYFTSGTNANLIRRVTAASITAGVTTLTFLPAASAITAAADTYQLIGKSGFQPHPDIINGFLSQAIIEVVGLAFDPEESIALHGDGRQKRFDIPSEFKIIHRIETRASVTGEVIHDAASAWDEAAAPSNVTRTVDTEDYKRASGANKFTVAAGFTTGLLSSKAISSLNLSGYSHVEFWIKCSIATAAADLQLLLDDTALSVSAVETLSVPALVANTWTYVRVALANPRLDTAIISVGLNYTVDIGACAIWINDVKAVNEDTAYWVPQDMHNWHIDEEARDLVFTFAPQYRLIKIIGGDAPALFSADTDTSEVDDQFLIARATELTLLASGGGPSTDPDAHRPLASYWAEKADKALRSMPSLTGRLVP